MALRIAPTTVQSGTGKHAPSSAFTNQSTLGSTVPSTSYCISGMTRGNALAMSSSLMPSMCCTMSSLALQKPAEGMFEAVHKQVRVHASLLSRNQCKLVQKCGERWLQDVMDSINNTVDDHLHSQFEHLPRWTTQTHRVAWASGTVFRLELAFQVHCDHVRVKYMHPSSKEWYAGRLTLLFQGSRTGCLAVLANNS